MPKAPKTQVPNDGTRLRAIPKVEDLQAGNGTVARSP